MNLGRFRIKPVSSAADLAAAGRLFGDYAAALGVDLEYQNFAAELAGLPGHYAAPSGELLLARDDSQAPVGCAALRPMVAGIVGEMKRLYVAPSGRGLGLGRALVDAIIQAAVRIGYHEVRLDTLPTMTTAIALYEQMGFVRTPPYYDTPVAGTIFLRRVLSGLTPAAPRQPAE